MRRFAILGVGLVLAVATTGCPGDVTSSPPPVISAITASPSPAVAGGPFTIEVHASHPDGIFEAHVIAITRTDGFLPTQHECANAGATPPAGSGPDAVVTISCTLPAGIQNGTDWSARVNVTSLAGSTSYADAPFSVIGGSDDFTGPVLTPVSPLPTGSELGAVIGVQLHLTDDHPPFSGLGSFVVREGATLGEPMIECVPSVPLTIDPTTAAVTFICTSPPGVLAGTHHVNFWASDDLGQLGTLAFDLVVT